MADWLAVGRDTGGDEKGDERCGRRDRLPKHRRQDEEPRLCVRRVREPPCRRHGQTQADSRTHPAMESPDRCGLGRAGAGRR